MSKRPPQRPSQRAAQAAGSRLPFTSVDPPGTTASPDGASAGSGTRQAAPVATSREELVDLLGDLRQQGSLGVADEAAILRRYDGLLVELRAEKAKLEAEFRERLERDGQDKTNAWLAEAAEGLGRRQGEQMRQLVQTIPGLASSPPA